MLIFQIGYSIKNVILYSHIEDVNENSRGRANWKLEIEGEKWFSRGLMNKKVKNFRKSMRGRVKSTGYPAESNQIQFNTLWVLSQYFWNDIMTWAKSSKLTIKYISNFEAHNSLQRILIIKEVYLQIDGIIEHNMWVSEVQCVSRSIHCFSTQKKL